MRKPLLLELSLVTLVLLFLTWLLCGTGLEIELLGNFFSEEERWFLDNTQPWATLDLYGFVPAALLTLAALIVLIASLFHRPLSRQRAAALLVVLAMAIGPGLVVNAVLKKNWALAESGAKVRAITNWPGS